ncbi:hypothetical protein D3C85_1731050 [compost metagenome]
MGVALILGIRTGVNEKSYLSFNSGAPITVNGNKVPLPSLSTVPSNKQVEGYNKTA